jgi:hypothetical protein
LATCPRTEPTGSVVLTNISAFQSQFPKRNLAKKLVLVAPEAPNL